MRSGSPIPIVNEVQLITVEYSVENRLILSLVLVASTFFFS